MNCCGRLRGPSDSRYPLPRLRLHCLHLGQESPARRPQTAGPGTRPHGSASAPPIALSARQSALPLLQLDSFQRVHGGTRPFSASVTRPHTHTFLAVTGVGLIGGIWDQSTTPLYYLILSLVKGTEGGNSTRPLILLVGLWGSDPMLGGGCATILVQSLV